MQSDTQTAEKMENKLAPWQSFQSTKLTLFFYLDIRNGHFIESKDYFFELVSVTFLT